MLAFFGRDGSGSGNLLKKKDKFCLFRTWSFRVFPKPSTLGVYCLGLSRGLQLWTPSLYPRFQKCIPLFVVYVCMYMYVYIYIHTHIHMVTPPPELPTLVLYRKYGVRPAFPAGSDSVSLKDCQNQIHISESAPGNSFRFDVSTRPCVHGSMYPCLRTCVWQACTYVRVQAVTQVDRQVDR